MAANTIQTNFTAGELSPRLMGRVDIARYQNAAKKILNATPVVHGGCKRRAGTRYIATVPSTEGNTPRLIPYVFNVEQAYVLEFGVGYMRVYHEGGLVLNQDSSVFSLTTPYLTAEVLWELDYCQGSDSMFIAHKSLPIHRLQRFAHNDWRIEPIPFVVEPFDEIGVKDLIALTLSDKTAGTGRTITAAGPFFMGADVGRDVVWSGGSATIRTITSDTVAVVDVSAAFPDVTLPSGEWLMTGSPLSDITPDKKDPVGDEVTLTVGQSSVSEAWKTSSVFSQSGFTVTVTLAGHGYSAGETLLVRYSLPGYGLNQGLRSGYFVVQSVAGNDFTLYMTSGIDTGYPMSFSRQSKIGASTWRSSDIGGYVKINGGLVQITKVNSATVAKGLIKRALLSTTKCEAGAWTLNKTFWNALDGYPSSVTLLNQRLFAAGSPTKPQAISASAIGNVLDFELWTNDDSPFSFTVDSTQANPIAFLATLRALIALTYGGEFTIHGGAEQPISAVNVTTRNQSPWGCAMVKPLRVGGELFFVQRGGRTLRALSYQILDDGYKAADVSVLAEHLLHIGIKQMTYQQSPDSMIWLVMQDGGLLSLTFDRDQEVIAWARHTTQGLFESVACIPSAEGDDVYVLVKRGNSRFVERMDSTLNTDAAITGASEGGAVTWTGLAPLEGLAVDVVADGVVMPPKTVTSGQIEIERPAHEIEIGLHYDSRIEMLVPEIQTQTGSSAGTQMRINEISVRLLESLGCVINNQVIPFRRFSQPTDQKIMPFTGDKRIENLGWGRGDVEVVIEQKQPLPLHVLAVIRKYTSGG